MLKIIRVSLILSLFLILSVLASAKSYRVAIFDYDSRPAGVFTIARHIEKSLLKTGLKFSEIGQFNSAGKLRLALSILEKLDNSNYDLIITITSDAMLPSYYKLKKTPWLFTNVNNPKFFGISDLKKPGNNMSGVTYYVPAIRQLDFFRKLLRKDLKRIGLIFDKKAKSKKAELREFRLAGYLLKINYKIEQIEQKRELKEAVKRLISHKVEAILLTSSDKLYNNVASILADTTSSKIPVFSVNKKGVEFGAVLAFASDYYKMVNECLIPMALDVLVKGKNPGEMPIRTLKHPALYLNLTQAQKIGLKIPAEIRQQASKTF